MVRRLRVTSKEGVAPLRRSARHKAQNPDNAISSSHGLPLSSHHSNLKSTPSSVNSKRKSAGHKTKLRGNQTCESNDCENVFERDTITCGTTIAPRRSPRFEPQNPRQPLSLFQSDLKLTPSSANLKRNNSAKKSRLAGKQLRRSPRFKPQNPSQPLSSLQSDIKLSPLKKNKCARKTRLGGKQSCEPNVGGIVGEKDTLGSVCNQRRSPRLVQIGTTSTRQDKFLDLKRRDCMVTKLGLEETCLQSACEIASDKIPISGPVNDQRRLRRSAKVAITSTARRRSPRLSSADVTSSNLKIEIKNKSKRSSKSEKHICPNEMGNSGLTVHRPNAQDTAAENNCTREQNSNCSEGRRKSHRLALQTRQINCENASDNAVVMASKPPLPPNHRRSKIIENRSNKITRKGKKSKHVVESDSDYESEDNSVGKKRKREESAETEAPVEFGKEKLGGILDGWTEEQEIALHKAYLLAHPSPHFWKKVSKMVI